MRRALLGCVVLLLAVAASGCFDLSALGDIPVEIAGLNTFTACPGSTMFLGVNVPAADAPGADDCAIANQRATGFYYKFADQAGVNPNEAASVNPTPTGKALAALLTASTYAGLHTKQGGKVSSDPAFPLVNLTMPVTIKMATAVIEAQKAGRSEEAEQLAGALNTWVGLLVNLDAASHTEAQP